MSNAQNPKFLALIFATLVGLYAFVRLSDNTNEAYSFNPTIATLDTAAIAKIQIQNPGTEAPIIIERSNAGWNLSKGTIDADLAQGVIPAILTQVQNISAERLASRSRTKWETFEVTDSLATRLTVSFADGTIGTDLLIGKFAYQQLPPNQLSQQTGRPNIKGTTYVRAVNEDAIFAVDGFLGAGLKQGFNAYRNMTLTQFNPAEVQQLTFNYPGDSSFVLTKVDSLWQVDHVVANQTAVEAYLNAIASQTSTTFEDAYRPTGSAQFSLSIQYQQLGLQPQVIEGFELNAVERAIRSSLNPKAIFTSTKSGLFAEIFKGKRAFQAQN